MEKHLPKKDYQEKIKGDLQKIIGTPLYKGDDFPLRYTPIPRMIFQEVYHKEGSTILLEEEQPRSSEEIRASMLIVSDKYSPEGVVKKILEIHPYFQIEKDEEITLGHWDMKGKKS